MVTSAAGADVRVTLPGAGLGGDATREVPCADGAGLGADGAVGAVGDEDGAGGEVSGGWGGWGGAPARGVEAAAGRAGAPGAGGSSCAGASSAFARLDGSVVESVVEFAGDEPGTASFFF